MGLELRYKRDYIPLRDGGQLSVDWHRMPHHEAVKDLKVILIFPGLGGSSDRMYIKYLVN